MHAVMDCRTVIIFLCMLSAQAACVPVGSKNGALSATIQPMREKIQNTLRLINESGVLPDIPCHSLNITGLFGQEGQPLTADHLSLFRCYMQEMSKLTPELAPELQITCQHTQAVESLTSGQTARQNCSLPAVEQDMDNYVHVKCLLELLDQRLSKATF